MSCWESLIISGAVRVEVVPMAVGGCHQRYSRIKSKCKNSDPGSVDMSPAWFERELGM